MARSHRALIVVLLSLLLIGMQQESLRHALTHWTSGFTGDQKQSLRATVNAPCDECALLASGTNAAAGSTQPLPVVSIAWLPVSLQWRSSPPSAPAYYLSRAPPSPL